MLPRNSIGQTISHYKCTNGSSDHGVHITSDLNLFLSLELTMSDGHKWWITEAVLDPDGHNNSSRLLLLSINEKL